MLKAITTMTLATGATVLALSLPLFADNSAEVENADNVVQDAAANTNITATKEASNKPVTVEKAAELLHPTAPSSPLQDTEKAAPAAPLEPVAQATKEEGTASKKNTANAEMTAPSGLFSTEEAVEKPKAPQQPVLSETTKKSDEAASAEPISVAPGVVSMGINPAPQEAAMKEESQAEQKTSKGQTYAQPLQVSIGVNNETAPAKPEAPKSVEKPVEMTPPQPENNATGNGRQGNTSSMNMPTMNMNMPQMNMPAMNMNMPATSMGTTVTPQAASIPVPVQQPATSAEH